MRQGESSIVRADVLGIAGSRYKIKAKASYLPSFAFLLPKANQVRSIYLELTSQHMRAP
jgi:hypothetical protein